MSTLLSADIERRAAAGDAQAQLLLARNFDEEGRDDLSRSWLLRAANAGDLAAKTTLGRHFLAHVPYDVREGVAWTVSAANDGSAQAAHLLAVLAATGIGVTQNWATALAYLQRGAELGFAPAQRELVFLAHADGTSPERESPQQNPWRRLREKIDIAAWLRPPSPRMEKESPRIAVVEGFAAPGLCDWLIDKARPLLKPAAILDPASGTLRYAEGRTNSAIYFNAAEMDFALAILRVRIAAVTGLDVSGMEAMSVLHYSVGQIFGPHFDFIDDDTPGYAVQLTDGYQRVVTFLLYLNDDYDGGETEFPEIGWRYKGRKGDAMFFWNTSPDGRPDRKTLHAGTAPARGEKWVLSQWIQARVRPPSR